MKKTVTICIISLSLCLIQAASPQDVHPKEPQAAANNEPLKTEINIVTTESSKSSKETANQAPEAKVDPNPANTKTQDTNPADNKQETKATDNKSTDNTKTEMVPKPAVEPSKNTDKASKTTDRAANETKPASNETKPAGNETSTPQTAPVKTTETPKNVTEKPTEAPKHVTEKPILAARGFDGPSFIGGIILTLGLLAIGFMGFKYYKNQTERNYHTL